MTTDTARVFFGVNVSCAKCHDHPLVADWKQDQHYGMAANGYDLDRLVAALLHSRVYQLANAYEGEEPAERHYARAALRPLAPQQYAMSLILASGNGSLDPANRGKSYRELESRIAPI